MEDDEVREKTINNLLDYLEKIQEEEEGINPDVMIRNFRELINLTKRNPDDQKRHTYIKNTILWLMIKQGGFYKSLAEYSSNEAIKMFKEVIRIETSIPIAHYRLGHLYYRKKNFVSSLIHFEKALSFSNDFLSTINNNFRLDEPQINNANLFVAINGLSLAKEKQDFIRNYDGVYKNITDQLIEELEIEYRKTEFVKYDLQGSKVFISSDEREALLKRGDLLILQRVDNEIDIRFQGQVLKLTINTFDFLKLLLSASKARPIINNQVSTYGLIMQETDQIFSPETLRQKVHRLRKKLKFNLIPLQIERGHMEFMNQGYYAISDYEYCVIEREETMIDSYYWM